MITRGKWEYSADCGEVHAIQDDGDVMVVAMLDDNDDDGDLLAAAPDMLAACEAVVAAGKMLPESAVADNQAYELARVAIAKARGES